MLMSNPPYWLWSIWSNLPILQKMFFLILAAVSFYCFSAAIVTIVRVRFVKKQNGNEDAIAAQRSVAALHRRCANIRQAIGSTFYLFGLVFFLGLQTAPRTLGHGTTPVGFQILDNFVLQFAFATNTFLVFLVLQLVSWFVCNRVNSSLTYSNGLLP